MLAIYELDPHGGPHRVEWGSVRRKLNQLEGVAKKTVRILLGAAVENMAGRWRNIPETVLEAVHTRSH